MRLRFLGTSAGELYPGAWCRCANCQQARTGSPRDRRRSAALYVETAGEQTLIDFPSEIVTQAELYGVDLPSIQNLLVTHSHGDHWFPYLLRWRGRPAEVVGLGAEPPRHIGAPRFTELPILRVCGNGAVEEILRRELGDNLSYYAIEFTRIDPGDEFRAGGLAVTALAANHDVGREEAVHYILSDGRHRVLYGLDGDTFLPETRQSLRGQRLDAVILESTFGFGDGGNHRNFVRLISEADWFRAEGVIQSSGILIATHFSPHHCPPHDETTHHLAEHGIVAAWDGMEIEL